jgi:histidinol-phosphate aminotransferase
VLVMIAEAFLTPQSEAVYSQYGFAVYPIAVQATGATARIAPANPDQHAMPLGHDLEAMRRLVNERTRVVFVANPNNPTGTWLTAQALRDFIAAIPPRTLVVVDEAYIEYVGEPEFPDASRWLDAHPNLIVTRTFSKAYGLAGLRVGYALSHPAVAGMLNRVRQAFNVNSVALAAARAALEDSAHLQRSVATNRSGMAQLQAGFDRIGLRHLPSVGNFVLVDCARPVGPIYEAMLRQGVIVRPVGNYQLPHHLRITIGTQAQNERMLGALQHALGSTASS